jgi:glycosyltransferase involved in cell wall biosynthesis
MLTSSLEDGIGMSVTYRALMLSSVCDVWVGVLFLTRDRNKRRLEQAEVSVVDLQGRHGVDPLSIARALKWARTLGADVVQAEQASVYPHAWMIARRLGSVLLVWLNTPISPFEGPHWRIRWASRFLFPRADHIVCNSEYTRTRLLKYYPSLVNRASVLYHPLAAQFFVPPRTRPSCRVGVVATMLAVKKLERLLKAWPEVAQYSRDATLDVYGDGPERPRWESLAAELGLERVRFHGFATDVAHALSQIGIFVLPTEGEAFGQVFVEAMLMERPCIGVRSGGVSEIVVDGETGVLIPPGDDPEPLAQAIMRLIDAPDQAEAMGKAGRERALAHFTTIGARSKYSSLYRQLLEGS